MDLQSFLRRLIWVCMAPLLAFGLVLLVIQGRAAQRAVDHALDDAAEQLKQALDLQLEIRLRALSALARSPLFDGPEFGAAAYAELQAYRQGLDTHVLLADEGGQMLLNTRAPLGQPLPRLPVPKGRSALDEAWLSGRPTVGDAIMGPFVGVWVVPLVAPVQRPGRPRSTLVASLETRWFQGFLDAHVLPQDVGAAIRDSAGATVARRGQVGESGDDSSLAGPGVVLLSEQSPYAVVLQMHPWEYHRPAMLDLAFVMSFLGLASLGAVLGARAAAGRFQKGLASLVAGSTSADDEDVLEIRAIRQRLQALDREREQSRVELRRLVDELARAQEGERRRIALDIHDDLQQRLAAIRLAADRLAGESEVAPTVRQQATALADKAGEAIRSTRRLINALRPQLLDDLGLAAALEDLVSRFAVETGIDGRFQERALDAPALQTATPLAISLFRVAQEALNYVAKHAQAQEVIVTLSPSADGGVELRVIDDGCGLQPRGPGAAPTMGLVGMRERMRAVGGELLVRPATGRGTDVIARAPIPAPPGHKSPAQATTA